ncbi:hypothetical protein ACOSQ4_014749 [Xanthoceras sorbifolium]
MNLWPTGIFRPLSKEEEIGGVEVPPVEVLGLDVQEGVGSISRKGSLKLRGSVLVGNTEELCDGHLGVKKADMVVEIADSKSRHWKRRAQDRLDRDSIMVPDGVRGNRTGLELSEGVATSEKIRQMDTEVANWQVVDIKGCISTCAQRLKAWNEMNLHNLRHDISDCRRILSDITRGTTMGPWHLIAGLEKMLDNLLMQDRIYWRQRSRINWLKNGDRNTHYFHSQASKRKKNNEIKELLNIHGEWKEDRGSIEDIVVSYFILDFHLFNVEYWGCQRSLDLAGQQLAASSG